MTERTFKKAVVPSQNNFNGLVQPKGFLNDQSKSKTWPEYAAQIKQEQVEYKQTLYSVAIEPSLKEAIQVAGRNRGRTKGGAKSIVRDALTTYLKKHPELLG